MLAASGVPALYIAIAIVTSTISQSFLDIVPSIFLGAPDDATALAVMPGHRMLLDGRGIEAVRLSAAGSGLAIVVSMLLIVPVSLIFLYAYPYMWGYMALILAAISIFIILSNRSDSVFPEASERIRKICHGALIFTASGFLGILAFAIEPGTGPDRKHRGADSIAAATIRPLRCTDAAHEHAERACYPPAGAQRFQPSRDGDREIGRPRHTVAGAMVSWFPAVSSGVATSITGMFAKQDDDSDRRYLIAVSGVNTSNAIFSLMALYVIGRPRSGAVAAAQELLGGMISFEGLILFLAVICVAGVLSYLLTLVAGGYAAGVFSRINYRWLNRGVLLFLASMCLLMTGVAGMAIFLMATAVGMAAHILNVRKTCLMGVLLLPCILYFL